jgi:hypothetical protein
MDTPRNTGLAVMGVEGNVDRRFGQGVEGSFSRFKDEVIGRVAGDGRVGGFVAVDATSS